MTSPLLHESNHKNSADIIFSTAASVEVVFPDKTIAIGVPNLKSLKQIRQKIVELQSYWLEYGFSIADTILDDRCWKLMLAIVGLLPRQDNSAITGFDLELLQTDLKQLEALFFSQSNDLIAYKLAGEMFYEFRIDEFKGCKLLDLLGFNARVILIDAENLRQKRLPKPVKTEPATDG